MTACKSNLKNLGTSLEMYSTDWAGHYPAALGQLTPRYMKTIPTCPGAQQDTYSQAFQSALGHQGGQPDAFTVCCQGAHHGDGGLVAPNYPQYTSSQGLCERP